MKKKSNKINFKSNSSRAIYNYVLENNYKITVKQACDELAVTPSQVYSLIGLLRKKGMNVRVIRKSVERQIYREARQYIEEHNCEISIAKACRDLNVSREQLNNMIHKFRKNGMQISIIQASDIIKLPLNKNTEEAVYQYIVDHNYSISSRQIYLLSQPPCPACLPSSTQSQKTFSARIPKSQSQTSTRKKLPYSSHSRKKMPQNTYWSPFFLARS